MRNTYRRHFPAPLQGYEIIGPPSGGLRPRLPSCGPSGLNARKGLRRAASASALRGYEIIGPPSGGLRPRLPSCGPSGPNARKGVRRAASASGLRGYEIISPPSGGLRPRLPSCGPSGLNARKGLRPTASASGLRGYEIIGPPSGGLRPRLPSCGPDTLPDVIHDLAERPRESRRSKIVDNSVATRLRRRRAPGSRQPVDTVLRALRHPGGFAPAWQNASVQTAPCTQWPGESLPHRENHD